MRRKQFICQGCKHVEKRRCGEDRWDFAEDDNVSGKQIVWPLYVEKGGQPWGFCPGKATWDEQAKGVFRLLVLASETGTMPYAGGALDQPPWFVDLLAWFIPRIEDIKFVLKCEKVAAGLGAGIGTGGARVGNLQR